MKWETKTLGELISTLKGYAFKSTHYVDVGVGIVRASDFTTDSISISEMKYYPNDERILYSKYELKTGDVLIQTVGSWEYNPASAVGKVVRVPKIVSGCLLNQNIVKISPLSSSELDKGYLFYRLKMKDFAKYNIGCAVGAANQASITLKTINAFTFALPPLQIQQRIASILSLYDDLIENYQQQIKLLEEAAQRLYKEWFVDLHFPGYENTKIVDGVPEGWEKKEIGEFLAKVKRTKQIPSSEVLSFGTIPVIDQSRNFIAGYTNDEEALLQSDEPMIVFGDHTRILKLIQFPFAKGADGTQLIMSANITRMPQYLFYETLRNVDLSNYSYARHFKYLKAESIIVPTEKIAYLANEKFKGYYILVQKRRNQLALLTEARDRLLPKLMSGEIEV